LADGRGSVQNKDFKARGLPPACASSDIISTSPAASDGHCSGLQDLCADRPVCHRWGPATFEESGALDELLADADVRKLPAGYDMEGLVRELAAGTATASAFFVVDLSTVMSKINDWKQALPRVKPWYAMKCNSDEKICRMLAQADCGFDCASKAVIVHALSLGVYLDKIIYANPCKQANISATPARPKCA
jgi:hypothetical protein